jgi:hypothetical protein
MALFAKLKDWSDDDPESLPNLAKEDEGVEILCDDLCLTAHFLRMNERRYPQLFAAPVDPRFLAAWRDYEDRFASPLARIWLTSHFPQFGSGEPGEIYTNVSGKPLDCPEYLPFWDQMSELGIPVWLHPARGAEMPDYLSEQKSLYEIWWTFGWSYETATAMMRLVYSKLMTTIPG